MELGTVPYRSLHHLYRACHVYVTPAYAESFAHPLVESMSSGLPVVASDLPVHREICRDAATYFPCFSPDALAERVVQVHQSPGLGRNALTKRPQPGARLPMGYPRGASAHLGPGTCERKSETRLSLGEKGDERCSSAIDAFPALYCVSSTFLIALPFWGRRSLHWESSDVSRMEASVDPRHSAPSERCLPCTRGREVRASRSNADAVLSVRWR